MEEMQTVPYIVYESESTRHERTIKRLIISIIISVLLIFASNAMWLYAWMQYDYIGEDITSEYNQDGEGLNIIGDGNEADYGSNAENQNQAESP